jgi:hypothetical protein
MTRRAVSRACGHRLQFFTGAIVYAPHESSLLGGTFGPGWATVVGQSKCARCGETMPLGPSNDAPDEVQVEMRAAELAAAWEPENGVHGLTTGCEHTGWDGWPYRQPRCTDEHTGFLAAQIQNHERDLGEVNWAGQHMADHPIHNHDRITEHGND